jgi:hypothetical protein
MKRLSLMILSLIVLTGHCRANAQSMNGNPGGAPFVATWVLGFAKGVEPPTTGKCVNAAAERLKRIDAQDIQTDDDTATGAVMAEKHVGYNVTVLCYPSNRVIFMAVAGNSSSVAQQIGNTLMDEWAKK